MNDNGLDDDPSEQPRPNTIGNADMMGDESEEDPKEEKKD